MIVVCEMKDICRDKDCRHYEAHLSSADCQLYCVSMNKKTMCIKEEK